MAESRSILAQRSAVNTPSILTSAGTALEANTARSAWMIQNLETNPLFVLMGSGASSTVFHVILAGGTADDDGKGGSISQESGTIYTGIITVAGTTPRFVVTEIT